MSSAATQRSERPVRPRICQGSTQRVAGGPAWPSRLFRPTRMVTTVWVPLARVTGSAPLKALRPRASPKRGAVVADLSNRWVSRALEARKLENGERIVRADCERVLDVGGQTRRPDV